MCDACGCGDVAVAPHHHHDDDHGHTHDHAHPHTHPHDHEHPHTHDHDHEGDTRTVTLEQKILAQNDEHAASNRVWLAENGITCINLISAPGSGKTCLLERTLDRLAEAGVSCAVITGDQKTDNDARRLEGKGAPVMQIETISSCHLEAERVGEAMREVAGPDTKLLFVENVGNLVCPTAFDLGENFKIALLSVTEGEDKPAKYPSLFTLAPVTILTKTDLIPHLDWDLATCRQILRQVHPGVFLFELSAKTGDGMDEWIGYLQRLVG